jgi:hypothetical protein
VALFDIIFSLYYYCIVAPWLYVLCIGTGAYIGNEYPGFKKESLDGYNQDRADVGLPPIVGTYGFMSARDDQKS